MPHNKHIIEHPFLTPNVYYVCDDDEIKYMKVEHW